MTVIDETRKPFARQSSSIPPGARPRELTPQSPGYGVNGTAGGPGVNDHDHPFANRNGGAAASAVAPVRPVTNMAKLAEATEENLVYDTKVNVRRFTYGQMKEVAAGIAKFLPAIPEECTGVTALALVEAALPDMLHRYATEEPEEPNETSLVPAEQPPMTVKVNSDVQA